MTDEERDRLAEKHGCGADIHENEDTWCPETFGAPDLGKKIGFQPAPCFIEVTNYYRDLAKVWKDIAMKAIEDKEAAYKIASRNGIVILAENDLNSIAADFLKKREKI